jgi:diadenosine tetraphosphate (Ap4A) HIT family hydrolase
MPGISEIIDLDPNEQVRLLGEIDASARALKSVATFEKLNIAALGNVVAQLHVHVIGRSSTDAGWPKPVWGLAPPVPYEAGAREKLIGALRSALKM